MADMTQSSQSTLLSRAYIVGKPPRDRTSPLDKLSCQNMADDSQVESARVFSRVLHM